MRCNATALDAELKAAGIPIDGCSSDGRVFFRIEATEAHRSAAAQVVAAHDSAAADAAAEMTQAKKEAIRLELERASAERLGFAGEAAALAADVQAAKAKVTALEGAKG